MSRMSSSNDTSHGDELRLRFLTKSHLEEEMFILDAVRKGANSMELLQSETNLPWAVLSDTAGFLLGAGFLTVDSDSQSAKLSLKAKGLDLIERYRDVVEGIRAARTVIEMGPN